MSKIPEASMNGAANIPQPVQGQSSQINEQQYMRLPPNLIRIRADDNDKKTMVFYWVIFLGIFVVMALLFLALPKQTVAKTNESELKGTALQNCKNPSGIIREQFTCTEFSSSNPKVGLIMLNIVPANQFYLLFLQIKLINPQGDLNISQQVMIEETQLIQRTHTTPQGQSTVQLEQGQLFFSSTWNITINKENSIPIRDSYNNQLITYRRFFGYQYDAEKTQNQFILLTFTQPGNMQNVHSIKLVSVLVNPQFSIFTIVIRIVFCVAAIISAIVFLFRYKIIPLEHRTIEQRLIAVQSILLIFFNDPLYAITILKPNGFMTFYSVFVVVNFIIFLLFTWIIFIERIFYENGKKDTQLLNWKKVLYAGIIYILTIVLLCLLAYYHLQEVPIVPQYALNTYQFQGLGIATCLIVIAGLAYILVQYVRSCIEIHSKLWRNQLFMYFFIFFLIVSIILTFAGGFQIFSLEGRKILLIYTMTNVYTFYMQHMYSIADDEAQKIKSGDIFIDDRRQVKSIMSQMDYGQVNLQLDTANQPIIQSVSLKEQYLSNKRYNQSGLLQYSDHQQLQESQNNKPIEQHHNKNNIDTYQLQ